MQDPHSETTARGVSSSLSEDSKQWWPHRELFPCSAVNSHLISKSKMCSIFSSSHWISFYLLSARWDCIPVPFGIFDKCKCPLQ